jgi:hypothetical protein
LVGALRPEGGRKRVVVRHPRDRDGRGGRELNVMRERAGGRRTAERTGFKVGVSSVMMMQMPRHRHARSGA